MGLSRDQGFYKGYALDVVGKGSQAISHAYKNPQFKPES